jgi:hypothetical protein
MFITMQGNWTVTVKVKAATTEQMFSIIGADQGSGDYTNDVGASITVQGHNWSILVKHGQGGTYQNSHSRIKFPTIVGTNYVFDIESNDVPDEPVYDDLVLSCSMPVTIEDYLIYGNVRSYTPPCLYNPCFKGWIVIDTDIALQQAILNPAIKNALKKLYPSRMAKLSTRDPSQTVPDKFTPMMINVAGDQRAAAKTANIYTKNPTPAESPKKTSKNAPIATPNTTKIDTVTFNKQVKINEQAFARDPVYFPELLPVLEAIPLFCPTRDVTFQSFNFQEYDRTLSEYAGNPPYSGEGFHEDIGSAMTDMNGNYLFRYTRTLQDILTEVTNDIPPGSTPEETLVEVNPDILVRIVDPSTGNVDFESGCYYNIPNFKQINLCFPDTVLPHPQVCNVEGANLIEYVGDIVIGGTQNTSWNEQVRATVDNKLDTEGRITAHDPTGPHNIDCACWVNRLDLRGCMTNQDIAWYTIRYAKDTAGPWVPYEAPYHHHKASNYNPYAPETKVGPFPQNLWVPVPGSSPVQMANVPAYMNIQGQNFYQGTDWLPGNIDILAQIQSQFIFNNYAGTVYFRVDVYSTNGQPLPNASDLIPLYIDNTPIELKIEHAYFEGIPLADDCVLFNLNNSQITAPQSLKVDFKVHQPNGFLNEYILSVRKGNNGYIYQPPTTPPIQPEQTHGFYQPAASCENYWGTWNTFSVGTDIVTAEVTPLVTSPWLLADQLFCTFAAILSCSKRCTDGYGGYTFCSQSYMFGIQRSG